jgi:xanthine dehydrogenase accessory factor
VLGDHVTATLAEELAGLFTGGQPPVRLIRLPVDEAAASAAGLSCGGTVTLALHDAGGERLFWQEVAGGRPVALVTLLDVDGGTEAMVVSPDQLLTGGLGDPAEDSDAVTEARKLLGAGRTGSRVLAGRSGSLVIEAVIPPARLVVVGDGDIAEALARQADLLGWRCQVAGEAAAATEAISELGHTDGVVVLSHDPEVGDPALASAVAAGPGYIGALGSRRTQAGRRERLLAAGVDEAALAAIHGPAGLDLGGRAPAEIALAICAEMLAVRAGRAAGALRERTGAING